MNIHILGIGGTFMAGIAALAQQLGHHVVGSDGPIYPPMSTQLEALGIQLFDAYRAENLNPAPDLVIIGNALSRGNPAVEYVLEKNIPYTSGPEWLANAVLATRHVLAVSGTHGKTTTTSMLTWILEFAGLQPGFLIGGIPENFSVSARLGASPYFVIEADEYDCAFFDKRSKFIHYHPRTLIMNNLEFDHADIFADMDAIKKQFSYLLRTVPGNGLVIYPEQDAFLPQVVKQGCWTPMQTFALQAADYHVQEMNDDGSSFVVSNPAGEKATVNWHLLGLHNVNNALAAIAASAHLGVSLAKAADALAQFKNVKKRLECKGVANGVTVYDDFAHHPTAIATTIDALRRHVGEQRIYAVLEFSSYTLREGVMLDQLAAAFKKVQGVYFLKPQAKTQWDMAELLRLSASPSVVYDTVDEIVTALGSVAQKGDHILVMGKTDFGNIHQKLLHSFETVETI